MKNIKKESCLGTYDELHMFAEIYNMFNSEYFPTFSKILLRDPFKKKPAIKKALRTVTIDKLKDSIASGAKWSYPRLLTVVRISGMPKEVGLLEFRRRGFLEKGSLLSTEGAILDKILCNRKTNNKTQAHVTKFGFDFILYTLECIDSNTYDESSTVEPAWLN